MVENHIEKTAVASADTIKKIKIPKEKKSEKEPTKITSYNFRII